jgi:four helix bundle protein
MGEEIKHFTDLDAWKVNHKLVLMIFKITKRFPKDERFGLIDQLRRAASSITANIAEGWGRYHFADKIRFYY